MGKGILSVLVLLGSLVGLAAAQHVTLAWDGSVDTNVTSYVLYWGQSAGAYTMQTNVGLRLTATVSNLPPARWFFVVTARDDLAGLESEPSNEVDCTLGPRRPAPPALRGTNMMRVTVTLQCAPGPLGPWCDQVVFDAFDAPMGFEASYWRGTMRWEASR